MPGDMALAGYLGTALALSAGLDAQAALALAVPLGLLGWWYGFQNEHQFYFCTLG